MWNTVISKKENIIQYSRCLIVIACISLSLFTLTSVACASSLASDEQTEHGFDRPTDDRLNVTGPERLTTDHEGAIADAPSDTTPAIRAGAAVFGATGETAGDAPLQGGFSETGSADNGDPEPVSHEPTIAEPDVDNRRDGAGGMGAPGVYLVVAEPDTPYTFSARGISSDHAGTYEPFIYAMEVDDNGMLITQHNLNFSGCYDWDAEEITFTTSHNTREFYVQANTWDCDGTFQVADVLLEVCEVPLPGVIDLRHTAGLGWINWTWVNPDVGGFSYVMVYLDGVYAGVTSDPFYNATGLDSGARYEIGTRTVGVDGGVSDAWVNQTGETAAGDDVGFAVRASDGLKFSLTECGAVSGVAIDGVELPMLSVPGGFSFRELSPTVSENLIANPGFENVGDGVPLNWELVGGAGTVVYDASEGHDSPGSIKVEVSGTADMTSGYPKSDLIDANPGMTYTFSAWGKSSGVGESHAPAVRVVELDHDGGWITQHNLVFDRDSDWGEKKTSFTTSSDVSKLYVYANIWENHGTFWVDDVMLGTCGTGDVSLEGAVEMNADGSITQYVTSSDIAFRFDYVPRDRYIEVHGDAQDLRGVDRAIQVQYELPVDATGWQWGDYIRKSRDIDSGVQYENVYKIGEVRTQNTYPFTFVGEDARGLSLAVPMDVPRIYRIGYGTSYGGYSIEYDFGLANCTDKIGHGHANFTFIVYKVDEPEWGFRSVADKYYELYPEFFVKRNENEGLWVRHDTSDIPDASDFGFAFDDSHYHSVARRVYNHQHGIYPMQYAEPWGWWRSFGDNPIEPSYNKKIAAVMDDCSSDTGMWRNAVTTQFAAEAVLNTAPHDENGGQYLDLPYLWYNWGSWSQNYPENPDPDLPSPNRYDLSYAKYMQSNVCGFHAYNWTFGPNCSINTVAHSGNYAGKIEISGTSDAISGWVSTNNLIPVTPSTEYNFSAWGKTQNLGGTHCPCVRVSEHYNNGALITQRNLYFGLETSDWTQKTTTFTTTADTTHIQIYADIWNGYGTFWVDDVELCKSGGSDNLVENHDFESIYDTNDYPCSGFYIDTILTHYSWPTLENCRREHWSYVDHSLVFSYSTKQPVLLGALSQYECLASMHENMTDTGKLVGANIFHQAYQFYGHLLDVLGSEVHYTQMNDDQASLRRTLSYQKTNSNLMQRYSNGSDLITNEEMENYINNQMFYSMFPSIEHANNGGSYADNEWYWENATLYERDRDLFKKYIPIIKEISAAGWEPIPYATCDNPNIKFERYGDLGDDLYYTVASLDASTESGVLSIDLSKLGFDGTQAEVRELVTDETTTQNVENGKIHITIIELHLHDTLVYKISP